MFIFWGWKFLEMPRVIVPPSLICYSWAYQHMIGENRLKFKTAGKLPIILEETIELTPI